MVHTRRRADATRNDELLLDAALEVLREKGPDRIAALDIARQAGLTTGAVYARYENNEEILVGLWQHRLAGPMHSFIETALKTFQPPPVRNEAQMEISRALSNPGGPLKPAISLMIASARIPELSEVIMPDITAWLHEFGITDRPASFSSDKRLLTIGFVIGCLYFAAVDLFEPDSWEVMKPAAHAILSHKELSWPLSTAERIQNIEITTDNAARDSLVNGAARVIARSGIDCATTQRIARAANVPTSTLFAEYRTRQALFDDLAAKLLNRMYRGSRSDQIISIPAVENSQPGVRSFDDPRVQQYRDSLMNQALLANQTLLAPAGIEGRRLRLEFHLGAMHDDALRQALQLADKDANEYSANVFERTFGLESKTVRSSMEMLRILAQGLMLLEDCTGLSHGVDARIIFEPVFEYVVEETIKLHS